MIEEFDSVRYAAYERLMTKPDPPELPRRGHVRLCDGDPDRRVTRLPTLHMGWLQRWCLENYGEEPPSARRDRPGA